MAVVGLHLISAVGRLVMYLIVRNSTFTALNFFCDLSHKILFFLIFCATKFLKRYILGPTVRNGMSLRMSIRKAAGAFSRFL